MQEIARIPDARSCGIFSGRFEMNHNLKSVLKTGGILVALTLLAFCLGCEEPEVRPGAQFDGSIYWALQIAQPKINTWASDAQIYSILGAAIWKDGRLPANTGTWSFVCWSVSLKKIYQITIDNNGDPSTSIREQLTPPSTASGTPLPAGWVNSTVIFAVIPAAEITKNYATLVAFNSASYSQAPNEAVWGINYAGGRNPLVRWNGEYIGTQSN
jgi:hypothetical protein